MKWYRPPLVGLMIAISLPVHASEEVNEQVTCEAIGELAESIMRQRQNALPMSTQMKVVGDNEFAKKLVILAYKETAWSTENNQAEAVKNFRNDVELWCYTN